MAIQAKIYVMQNLGEFIAQEIRKRDMSDREFAEFVGVSNATIHRAMSPDAPTPTLEFLQKLARKTGVDICTLVALVMPNDTQRTPEVDLIATRVAQLPLDKREFLDDVLVGLLLDAHK